MLPWGTPQLMLRKEDLCSFRETYWQRFSKYDFNNENETPRKPYENSLSKSIPWLMQSNALLKSRKMPIVVNVFF